MLSNMSKETSSLWNARATSSIIDSQSPEIVFFDSEHSCTLQVNQHAHNHFSVIEQNGLHATVIVRFDSVGLLPQSKVLFPTSIAFPGNPRGYLSAPLSMPPFSNTFNRITYDGIALRFFSFSNFTVTFFASPTQPTAWTIVNYTQTRVTPDLLGVVERSKIRDAQNYIVWKDERWISQSKLQIAYTTLNETDLPNSANDLAQRKELVKSWTNAIQFNCPVDEISTLHHFAKCRAQESVYDATKLGLVHSPGGGMFYAGVWCNDQAEYAAPALAMLGGPGSRARQVAVNSLLVLARWFDVEKRKVPYSVEADGGYIGLLDRGDAGMYAWGASLTLLTCADPEITRILFPHIRFTCDLLLEKINSNPHGIVPSETDELEGRFPSGDANLSVNCICILALEASAEAAVEAEESQLSGIYAGNAVRLRENVDRFFIVSGPQAYAYFKGCKETRGWACLAALAKLSRGKDALQYVLDKLWSEDGILTASSDTDVWDRCTLYAIRTAFQVDAVETASNRLVAYARKRTTEGCAIPYAIENNSSYAQLSAESALIIRVVTEGLLGIRVEHGGKLRIRPQCPVEWTGYSVTSIFISDKCVDFQISRVSSWLVVEMRCDDRHSEMKVDPGVSLAVQLRAKSLLLEVILQ